MAIKFISLRPFNNAIFYGNAIFDNKSVAKCHYLITTKDFLATKNIVINTFDKAPKNISQKDVYMDIPYPWNLRTWIRIINNRNKNILFIVEPPIVNPFNFIKIFHTYFSKIYIWNQDLVNSEKYIHYCIPMITRIPKVKKVSFKSKQLLIMMNTNWLPFLPFKLLSLPTKEFYTERLKALEFCDKFYPLDFCLYGKGWNKPQRFSIKQRIFGFKKYKTYRGSFKQKDKYNILSRFKFCLCFDNCESKGNISEKIFDCFKARCVPVYLGASDIDNYINNNCFVDFREFKDYKGLLKFLNSMDEKTYNTYLNAIEEFLFSIKFQKRWSSNSFATLFLKAIS